MNNLRDEGQSTLGSAIYEPAGALAKRRTLADNDLQQLSREFGLNLIYDLKSYIKRYVPKAKHMSNKDILADIMPHESLDGLAAFLQSQPKDAVRNGLLKLFDEHAEYKDADQWAAAVRICEALAIVGWSSRERVDAISHFNGDCWDTRFVNEKGAYRFRAGKWRKRKGGWVLFNPQYHFSPDRPDKPPVNWQHFANVEFPIVDRSDLPSQRNYRKQLPIIMGLFCGSSKTSNTATALKAELTAHLRDAMHPDTYGAALEFFYFTLHCAALSESFPARLKIGAYNTKQKAFYCDLYFDDAFGTLAVRQQREYFAHNLLVAIDELETKLKKRKINYDIPGFRSDVVDAIEHWYAQNRT